MMLHALSFNIEFHAIGKLMITFPEQV